MDSYYPVNKFEAAYALYIPALPDKSEWPKYDKGFFMHPPLLIKAAGRPRKRRYQGCTDNSRAQAKKAKKGHMCPICKAYGHHWHSCRLGDPEDIAAYMATR